MMSLSSYLVDLRQPPTQDAPGDPSAPSRGSPTSAEIESYAQYRVDEAMARASVALNEALTASSEQQRVIQAAWSNECQDRLSREAAEARAAFECKVSLNLAQILSPFLERWQRERVRASFVSRLAQILSDGPEVIVTVAGPNADCNIVADSLGKLGVKIVLRESEGDRLEAEVGSTVVRADFSCWPAQFATILEGLDRVEE